MSSFNKGVPSAVLTASLTKFNYQWLLSLETVLRHGYELAPRGMKILEVPQATIVVPISRPVLTVSARKLSYSGMLAEALWIVSGSDKLRDIEPYLPRMREFSDDGETLNGAYGPRYLAQRAYVVEKLVEDRDTRQATMTLWTPNPLPSKDIPCTVAMDFKIRDGKLNSHVFMRSSDVWLGLPYDVFSFSMMAVDVLQRVNRLADREIEPGRLFLTAASSHLYERDREKAMACLTDQTSKPCASLDLGGRTVLGLLSLALHDKQKRWWNDDYTSE
jgi:thymidylate synthase